MLNEVNLIGNLGADPEIRRTQDGRPIATLRIATSESWRDKNTGEKKERTEWHRVVVFSEGLAKVCEQYLKKGQRVFLSGKLQTRKWEDQAGVERYTTEVVLTSFDAKLIMLDRKKDGPGAPESEDDYGTTRTREPATAGTGTGIAPHHPHPLADLDDEIPF